MQWLATPGAWLATHLAIAVAGTWAARRYALRRRLLDEPGERRSHAVATPRGGGVAIVLSLLAASALLACWYPEQRSLLAAGGGGILMVAAIGWLDDHRPLSPWLRLGVHVLAAGLLAAAIVHAGGGPVLAAIAFIGAVVLVNVWNFMDGIDGLAASQAAIAALGYGILAGGGAAGWLAFGLVAACSGFLPFNFPRARIFLGDVGSGALGYGLALAAVLLMAGPVRSEAWPLLLLPLSAFLVDATLTLGRRMLNGESWWRPHVQHAYQVWSRKTGRHPPVTLAYAGWSVASVALMWAMTRFDAAFIIVTTAAWCLVGGLGWFLLQTDTPRMTGRKKQQ